MRHVVVIGGGPAGMVAAIMAARDRCRVTLLERMQRVGRKLLATGNGRCNLANRAPEMGRYHGGAPEFVRTVFAQFGLDETLAFFESLGVPVMEEEDGKLFPVSQQASSVLDVLRYEMEQLGVVELCEWSVQAVQARKGGYRCVCGDSRVMDANRVVVCTGGKSSPNLGSNGGGYRIAEALGHTVVEPFPALVQVHLDAAYLNQLAGVGFQGRGEVWVDGRCVRSETGELLFAKYGISGTAILQLSRAVSEHTLKGRDTRLRLDLFPGQSEEALAALFRERMARSPYKPLAFSFVGFLHKRLIPVVLDLAGIENQQAPCGGVSEEAAGRVAAVLKAWTIPCTGTQSWMYSQVTAGGVDVREVDPVSMKSRLAPGVHFAGEVLDVDGDSGGFNLQWAWSTGALAGQYAAQGE